MGIYALAEAEQAALNEATTAATTAWTTHARPIVVAMLAMEAPTELHSALCDNHYGRDDNAKMLTRDYREAKGYIETAHAALRDMLHGIRDNYRCDYARDWPMDLSSLTEVEADAIERFNTELDAGIMSVEAFVNMVEGEVYGA